MSRPRKSVRPALTSVRPDRLAERPFRPDAELTARP